jgi:hypothetical protein
MILGAIYFSIFMPLAIQSPNAAPSMMAKPYVVKAVVDSARIIGFPPSRAARDYARKIQLPDPMNVYFYKTDEPVSSRQLFFRQYFQS